MASAFPMAALGGRIVLVGIDEGLKTIVIALAAFIPHVIDTAAAIQISRHWAGVGCHIDKSVYWGPFADRSGYKEVRYEATARDVWRRRHWLRWHRRDNA